MIYKLTLSTHYLLLTSPHGHNTFSADFTPNIIVIRDYYISARCNDSNLHMVHWRKLKPKELFFKTTFSGGGKGI